MKLYLAAFSVFLATSCASTSITPLTNNSFLLQTSAAPACGASGSAKVAAKMAAIETLKRGYSRFIISAAGAQNNVSVINRAPTYANTSTNVSVYGNTAYGNSTTTFGGGGPLITGSRDTQLQVLMLNPGDQYFQRGVDAKQQLGADWEQQVAKGIATCT